MAKIGTIVENLMNEIAAALEGLDPQVKTSERFIRQAEGSRLQTDIDELTGRARLFEFDRENIEITHELAGAGTSVFHVGLTVKIMYPTAHMWHTAALTDWIQAYEYLAANASSVSGVSYRVIDLDVAPNPKRVGADNWMLAKWKISAIVDADV